MVTLAVEQQAADRQFMALALDEARKGRFWASPNPHVGCVLVRDGTVIGTGFTQPAGQDHAEIQALKAAGDARGATAYVTLEPCAHTGRTGPCADALIAAGVTRVVGTIEDPHPQVAGEGFRKLRAAGVAVDTGLMAAEAEAEIRGFLLRIRRGYGRVCLKVACSLDGRTAMASGESQWITGPAAREDVQLLRARSSFIVTGVGTVLADDCALTVRAEQLPLSGQALTRAQHRKPVRVVLDTHARAPRTCRIFNDEAPTLRFSALESSASAGVETMTVAASSGGLDLDAVIRELGQRGGNDILIEAGATLSTAFLKAGLVDELVVYQAPVILGASARPLLDLSFDRLADGLQLEYAEISRVGRDLRIIATVGNPQGMEQD